MYLKTWHEKKVRVQIQAKPVAFYSSCFFLLSMFYPSTKRHYKDTECLIKKIDNNLYIHSNKYSICCQCKRPQSCMSLMWAATNLHDLMSDSRAEQQQTHQCWSHVFSSSPGMNRDDLQPIYPCWKLKLKCAYVWEAKVFTWLWVINTERQTDID